MKTAIVIPARLESTRLPRKLLLQETGKTLIEHTYLASQKSQLAESVIVATDSQEILEVVESFGGRACLTSDSHRSGTDRIAEVAEKIDAELIVNVQGDEPEIDGRSIDRVFQLMKDSSEPIIASLASAIETKKQLHDPANVKVVFDRNGKALYFSRSPIPTARESSFVDEYFAAKTHLSQAAFFQHVGIYGYHRCFLEQIPNLPPSSAERIESLEQLRFLHQGWPIYIDVVDHKSVGIDTAEDYELFVNRQSNG